MSVTAASPPVEEASPRRTRATAGTTHATAAAALPARGITGSGHAAKELRRAGQVLGDDVLATGITRPAAAPLLLLSTNGPSYRLKDRLRLSPE